MPCKLCCEPLAQDTPMSFGALIYPGRQEACKIRENLASFNFNGSIGQTGMFTDCHVELLQIDVTDFDLADQSVAAGFLLKLNAESRSGKLRGAEARLSIGLHEGIDLLDIAKPPDGLFAEPQEVDGVFQIVKSEPGFGLFVGYETVGMTSCGLLGKKGAIIRLSPDQGPQGATRLSGVVVLCLPLSSRLKFDKSITVQASFLPAGPLEGQSQSSDRGSVRVASKTVQLVLMH